MDKEAFARRVLARERTLYCIARTLLPPRECEDAVQNAVLRAWEKLSSLRDESSFDTWLARILTRECYAILRARRRDALTAQAAAQLLVPIDDTAYERRLTDALNRLSPQDRLLLLLHHDEGYSLAEVARITGAPQGVLKMRLHRARNRLLKLLKEEDER